MYLKEDKITTKVGFTYVQSTHFSLALEILNNRLLPQLGQEETKLAVLFKFWKSESKKVGPVVNLKSFSYVL